VSAYTLIRPRESQRFPWCAHQNRPLLGRKISIGMILFVPLVGNIRKTECSGDLLLEPEILYTVSSSTSGEVEREKLKLLTEPTSFE